MATETFQKELDGVKSDLGNLKKHVNQLLETAFGKGKDTASSTFETVKSSSMKATDTCKLTIEKHPLACVLVALGIGLVLGKIMNHK